MNSQQQKTDFIINRRAGTVLRVGEDAIRQAIVSNFDADKIGEIKFIEGSEVATTVKGWAAAHTGEGRGLIIGGGDGTVLTAATQIFGRNDIILGVLPLGTQNLFSRRLGFSTDFNQAAAQYKDSEACSFDVGHVNGMNFLVGLMADQHSVRFFETREDLRDKKHLAVLKKSFALALQKKQDFLVSGQLLSTHLLVVMNNEIKARPSRKRDVLNPQQTKTVAGNMFAQAQVSDGKLALYAYRAHLGNVLPLLKALQEGTWMTKKSVIAQTAQKLVIEPAGKQAGAKDVTIILDGEIKKTQYPLNISITPNGLKVYRPK